MADRSRITRAIQSGGATLALAGALVVGPVGPSAPRAQDDPPAAGGGASDEKGKWVPLFTRHAGEYEVVVGSGRAGEARRLDEPSLRWWQPVRGGDDGALYLWIKDGRPAAAITFFTFKWPDGKRAIVHERHSLATAPVAASWRGATVWNAPEPGVEFRPIPEAPEPAATPAARLRQMQALVREFSAETRDDKDSAWPLRPLARPLYRYEVEGGEADGALFALVQGTDPEAFLLVESRPVDGRPRWHYAVARFTDLRIGVRHKGREVFSAPNTTGQPGEIYHSSTVLLVPSDDPADFDAPGEAPPPHSEECR